VSPEATPDPRSKARRAEQAGGPRGRLRGGLSAPLGLPLPEAIRSRGRFSQRMLRVASRGADGNSSTAEACLILRKLEGWASYAKGFADYGPAPNARVAAAGLSYYLSELTLPDGRSAGSRALPSSISAADPGRRSGGAVRPSRDGDGQAGVLLVPLVV